MQKQDREILKIFQTEDNRKIEEDFASMLSENPNLRLFFINENQAYTDGKNIVVEHLENHGDDKTTYGSDKGDLHTSGNDVRRDVTCSLDGVEGLYHTDNCSQESE